MPKDCNPRRKKSGESDAQYRKRCGPRPLGQIKMGEKKNPRIPRKKGQKAGSKKHSDLYTDENPRGTIHGLKFATVKDAKASVSKIKNSGKKHAHKIQAAIAMEQRARAAGKTSQAAVYRAYINKMKKITKKRNEVTEKKWSQKYKKSIDCNNPKGFSQKAHCAGRKKKKQENVMKITKSKLREMIEEEYFNYLVEKNIPTNPSKWSYYKSQAKKKFDVYPSAYANAWAAKMYKKAGGGWKKAKKENIELKKKDKNSSIPFGSGYEKVKEGLDDLKNIPADLRKNMKKARKNKVDEKRGPCWKGYSQIGMKKKGNKMVPNCVKNEDYIVENLYDYKSFTSFMKENYVGKPIQEAEYQGKKVELGKVKRGGDKKFYVYVKDPKTKNVKKVSFGDTTGLSIKTKDPDRRRNFRARHNCDNPGPKTKARYWSCRMWSGPDAVKNMLKK